MSKLLLAALLVTAGCSRMHVPHPGMPSMPSMPSFSRHHDDGPTDGNIVAIVLAENNTDISYAKLVPNHTKTANVRDFASRMITDHEAVNRAMNDVMTRFNLAPEENKMSLDFRDESTEKREMLKQVEGSTFDSTYIANEISYHTKFLETLDKVLIPNADNPQLKQVLVSIRPAVADHLQHAQTIQGSLKRR